METTGILTFSGGSTTSINYNSTSNIINGNTTTYATINQYGEKQLVNTEITDDSISFTYKAYKMFVNSYYPSSNNPQVKVWKEIYKSIGDKLILEIKDGKYQPAQSESFEFCECGENEGCSICTTVKSE